MITIDPIKRPIPNIFGNSSVDITEIFNQVDQKVTEKLEEFKDNIPSGNGVPIVDSEEKLETLDLPQGSLASVAYNTLKKISFRDLYQPTMNDLDMNTGSLVNPDALSKVSKLEFTFPEGLQSGESIAIYLVTRTFSVQNPKMISLDITANDDMVGSISGVVADTNYKQYVFCEYDENGIPSVNQENIDALNELLTTDDWCYFGYPDTDLVITEEQFDILDKFVKSASGVQGADLYIKESSKFVKQETKILSKVPANLSSFNNDVGYLTELNGFKNIEQIDYLSPKETIELKEDTLIYITSGQIDTIKIKIKTPDSGMKKYGLFFDPSAAAGTTTLMFYNYICWKNPIPLEETLFGKNLIVIEYLGYDNMFIGDYHQLVSYKLNVTYNIPEIGVYPILNKDYPLEYINGCDSHEREFNKTGSQTISFETEGLNDKMFDGIDNIQRIYVDAPYVDYAFNNIPLIDLSNNCRYFTVFDTDSKFQLSVSSVQHLIEIYFNGGKEYKSIFNSISALYLKRSLCKDLIIPKGTKIINNLKVFQNCTCLDSITIEKDVMFHDYCFLGCTGTLILNAKPTYYQRSATFNKADFNRVIINNNIGSLDDLFKTCAKVEKYDFSLVTEIPSITQTSFSNISNTCQIVVPDNLYDEWIVAENWSNYASQIVKVSEYVEPTE